MPALNLLENHPITNLVSTHEDKPGLNRGQNDLAFPPAVPSMTKLVT
jgi:hypothetical protein